MSVFDLTDAQFLELKQNYLCMKQYNVSYFELANADALIDDSVIIDEYASTIFSEDDFFTN